jgi:hypothetical protein
MNVAGKSLQDIYDAGSKRLDELESGQSTSMRDTSEAHLDERARVEPESLKRLEDRTEELSSEIKTYLDRGLERVQKAVSTEGAESERHIQRLVESLVLLSKKFSESIGQLREAAESELSDLAADSHHIYKSNCETTNNQLREESTSALDAARTAAAQTEATEAEKLEANWKQVYSAEDDSIRSVTKTFNDNVDKINNKGNETRRSLEEVVDQKVLTLEGRLSQSSDNLRTTVDTVTEQAERHAFDADVHLKEKFSSLLYEMSTSFDDSATRAAADLASLHESSMADLTMKSQELSREMDSLAEDVTNIASQKNDELQAKGTELLAKFTDDLNQRLEQSNVFLKEIEGERAQQVSEIWQELTEVKNKFEEKLSKLAQDTLDKMNAICTEAESAVYNAQQNCLTESKNHAQSKREGIESEARNFIDRVTSTKQAALDAIAKAAGASQQEMDATEKAVAEEKKKKDDEEAEAAKAKEEDKTAAEAKKKEEEDDEENPVLVNPHPVGEETMIDGDAPGGSRRKNKKGSDKRSGDKK